MKKVLLLIVALVSSAMLFAQSTEVVYLKNGSIIKGVVT